MRIQTVHSDFQEINFLSDIVTAGCVEDWIGNIVRGNCSFHPLKLILNQGGNSKILIDDGVFAEDATTYSETLSMNRSSELIFPNDKIDIYMDLERKHVTINIRV